MPAARNSATPNLEAPAIHVTRLFDAPRAMVFAAWTTAEHLKHWWGPRSTRSLARMQEGWCQTVERFAFHIAGGSKL